jgi:hypothetical protein
MNRNIFRNKFQAKASNSLFRNILKYILKYIFWLPWFSYIYFTNSSATSTLQTQQRMITTTEHREPDVQTKIDIYLGPPTRLRGSENHNFVEGLEIINTTNYVSKDLLAYSTSIINTEKYVDSIIYSDWSVDLNIANNEPRCN